jgi:selenide,water dikinase
VTITLDAARIPVFRGVLAIAGLNKSGGLASNEAHFSAAVTMDMGVDPATQAVLYDPQTSGGLLIAVSADAADRVGEALGVAGVTSTRIGHAGRPVPGTRIVVLP